MSMIELSYFRKKFHNESMVGQFVFPYTSATYECILQIQEYESISSKSLKNDTYQTSANSGSKFTISDASEKKLSIVSREMLFQTKEALCTACLLPEHLQKK